MGQRYFPTVEQEKLSVRLQKSTNDKKTVIYLYLWMNNTSNR